MNKIKVTPERLLATSELMEKKSREVKQTAADMISLVTGISRNIWSGEAQSSYIGKFRGLESDAERMHRMIEKQARHLASIAREYKQTEQKSQQAAAALKNNVLS